MIKPKNGQIRADALHPNPGRERHDILWALGHRALRELRVVKASGLVSWFRFVRIPAYVRYLQSDST